ncbi:MAG: SMC-Scp complex subunit ScpB [Oligoflexia bacterium]|nr:SMC-Scp complex subunit ScpB [Oligoflexia bacterium]
MDNEKLTDESFADLPLLMALKNNVENEVENNLENNAGEGIVAVEESGFAGITFEYFCAAIESLIFISDRPLSLTKIKECLYSQIKEEISLTFVSRCIMRLQKEYELSHHGIRLLEVAEGYQFRTKVDYSKFIQSMFKVSALVLSPSAIEVLAIIAYRQPITRLDIDRIRGVDNAHLIRSLLDKKLIKMLKRSDDLGKQVLYGTTDYFLEMFSLKDLKDLPPEHELELMSVKAELGKIGEIKDFLHGGFQSSFTEMELAELDELSKSIKAISADTEFTHSLKMQTQQTQQAQQVEGATNLDSEQGLPDETAIVSPKSAFDILEEFVLKKEIIAENRAALKSISLLDWKEVSSQLLYDERKRIVAEVPVPEIEEIIVVTEVLESTSDNDRDGVDAGVNVDVDVDVDVDYWLDGNFSDDVVDNSDSGTGESVDSLVTEDEIEILGDFSSPKKAKKGKSKKTKDAFEEGV